MGYSEGFRFLPLKGVSLRSWARLSFSARLFLCSARSHCLGEK